ncbi:hypothetical protein KCP73_24395 [Salmonella enterica subsp. enterica]|nr:hypothetical protein KCP73_24395 [Salmonella enterica subsp. enterica]
MRRHGYNRQTVHIAHARTDAAPGAQPTRLRRQSAGAANDKLTASTPFVRRRVCA